MRLQFSGLPDHPVRLPHRFLGRIGREASAARPRRQRVIRSFRFSFQFVRFELFLSQMSF